MEEDTDVSDWSFGPCVCSYEWFTKNENRSGEQSISVGSVFAITGGFGFGGTATLDGSDF